jgi:hypothetical protein
VAINSDPGEEFVDTQQFGIQGLVGIVGVQIIKPPAGTIETARTTTVITEQPPSSGIYHATLTAPTLAGTYTIVWDTSGGSPIYAYEDLIVGESLAPPFGVEGRYAQQLDFEAYVEGWVTDDEAALDRYLERASRDVDRMVGAWLVDEDSGLKFGNIVADENPKDLSAHQLAALRRATCAQALYRINLDDARDVVASSSGAGSYPAGAVEVAGPEFRVRFADAASASSATTATADRPYPLSAAAWDELVGTGLIKTTATAV